MKTTNLLDVTTDLYLNEEIVIHPNDGYDLGLYNTTYQVKIFLNELVEIFNLGKENFCDGNLTLENSCKNGTVKINKKYWKKIGMPEKVRLYYDNDKILIASEK